VNICGAAEAPEKQAGKRMVSKCSLAKVLYKVDLSVPLFMQFNLKTIVAAYW